MPVKMNPFLDLTRAVEEREALDEEILKCGFTMPCNDPALSDCYFSGEKHIQEKMADMCMECPAAVACRAYALAANELNGVWGGLTEWDRDKTKTGTGKRGRPAGLSMPRAPRAGRPAIFIRFEPEAAA